LSPEELADRVADANLDVVALTDHDTTNGIAPFRRAARNRFSVISGCEISTNWRKRCIHIVALDFDEQSARLQSLIADSVSRREQRNVRIAGLLTRELKLNEDIYQLARAEAENGEICRPHFAKALVNLGIVRDSSTAFQKWLGNGKKCAASVEWPELTEVIEAIHCAGGVAVLAHPLQYKLTRTKLNELLDEFAEANGDAVEVATPDVLPTQVLSLIDRVTSRGFSVSGGSDYHDDSWGGKAVGSIPTLPDGTPLLIDALTD
jgi:hypothetical protein